MAMKTITKEISINASKDRVWKVLLGADTYTQWAGVFSPDGAAHVETDWQQGSRVKFTDGSGSGIGGVVTTHVPNETIAITYDVEYGADGVESHEGEMVGGVERYDVSEQDGVTHLSIHSDMAEQYVDMMSDAWDKALARIKELVEQS